MPPKKLPKLVILAQLKTFSQIPLSFAQESTPKARSDQPGEARWKFFKTLRLSFTRNQLRQWPGTAVEGRGWNMLR